MVVGQPLPPARLRGTAKQVHWARNLRAEVLADIHAIRDGAAARLRGDQLDQHAIQGYTEIVEAADTLVAEERASWWIDHRRCSAHSLLQERIDAARQAAALEGGSQ
jgi:hypothetical protein